MSWYKQSMSENYINSVLNQIKHKDSNGLEKFFNGKQRFIAPLTYTFMDSLKTQLEEKGYKVDLDKKIAYKKHIDQNKNEKWQPIGLGKLINREFGKEALDKYSLDEQNFKKDEYSILFSRNPIDVLRMSDFEGIKSCHSQGGNYFACAMQEAIDNGAVAYVVRNQDIQNIDLEADEIFADTARKVKGITPLSRIRLRRLLNKKTNEEIALPEDRIYGKRMEGFEESVLNIARDKQKNIIQKYKEKERTKDFVLTGGEYQDTDASDLLNNLFEDDADTKSIKHETGGAEAQAEIWQEELDAILTKAHKKLKYFSVYAEADTIEDRTYINSGVSFYLPNYRNYFGDLDSLVTNDPKWEIKSIIGKAFDFHISQIDFRENHMLIHFETEAIDNPDDVEALVNQLEREENNILNIIGTIAENLEEEGYISPANSKLSKLYEDLELGNLKYKNLSVSLEKNIIEIDTFFIILQNGMYKFAPEKQQDGSITNINVIESIFSNPKQKQAIEQYIENIYFNEINADKQIIEETRFGKEEYKHLAIKSYEIDARPLSVNDTIKVSVNFIISIYQNNKTADLLIKFLNTLDNRIPSVNNEITTYIQNFIKSYYFECKKQFDITNNMNKTLSNSWYQKIKST